METIGKELKTCLACANGYWYECTQPVEDTEGIFSPCGLVNFIEAHDKDTRLRGGQVKDAVDITDVQSTGRKRAVQMYPITEGMKCEWQSLARAGGGVVPSIGCHNGMASNVHHGPDKNTLNNGPENVHRICSFCHNWWHAQNDVFYGTRPSGTEPFIPLDTHKWTLHNAIDKVSLEEVIKEQLKRGIRKDRRVVE